MDYLSEHFTATDYPSYDDGLGGLMDDGLGTTGYQQPASKDDLDEPEDYMSRSFMAAAPPPAAAAAQPAPEPAAATLSASQPGAEESGVEPLDDNNELSELLDVNLGFKAAAEASRSQQDEESDLPTEDEAMDTDSAATRSRESSQQPGDTAQAELERSVAYQKQCYDAMTETQRNRLEAYHNAALSRKTLKKVLQDLTGTNNPNDKALIALGTVTKMFVGELVAKARLIAGCQGHVGALLPVHIRAAYQVLAADGKVPHKGPSKRLRLQ